MATLLNLKELRNYLEVHFEDKKEELMFLNKQYRDDRSFLSKTYCVEWPFERGNTKLRVIVFRDLPSPYPEQIYDQIRAYMRQNGFDAEFKFWTSYQALKALDPVRVLRN